MSRPLTILLVLCIIFSMVCMVLGFMNDKSPICDEVAHHIASGYSYAKLGDYRMNPSTPALIRTLIGLPLLHLDLELPIDHVSWQTNDSPVFGRLFLYERNKDHRKIVFLSRLPVLFLSVALSLGIFFWSYRLYGAKAGLLAMSLYAFSPNILGNSGLAMTDIGGALFMFLAVATFRMFIEKQGTFNIFLSGAALGLAQSSKHSAIILYPLLIGIALLYGHMNGYKMKVWRNLAIKIVGLFFVSVLVLWATYGFEFKPLLLNAPDIPEKEGYITSVINKIPFVAHGPLSEKAVYIANNTPVPLSSFIISLLGVLKQASTEGQRLFFAGKYHAGGMPYYYVALFFIKTTLPVIFMTAFSTVIAFKYRQKVRQDISEICIISFIAVFFAAASFSRLQGGVRYILPIYPFLYVWISGKMIDGFARRDSGVLKKVVLVVLLVWHISASVATGRDFLGYSNGLIRLTGKEDYEVIHDMDWGQDLILLKKFVDAEDIPEITIDYFGQAEPEKYGIPLRYFSGDELRRPENRVYAVSIRSLGQIGWTRHEEPSAKIGSSIFVYDLRNKVKKEAYVKDDK